MKKRMPAAIERQIMTEAERDLLKRDMMRVAEEYFETDGEPDVDITSTQNGYSVCLVFGARRIKYIKTI